LLDRLRNILRTDSFDPSSAVFPSINSDKLSHELKLKDEGKGRGSKNLPGSEDQNLDSIEMRIVQRVEELRRKGLENYENHQRIYAERLSRAAEARKEVEIVAGKARTDFLAEVKHWNLQLATPTEKLFESYRWRQDFREKHRLSRPANEFGGWLKTFALVFMLILVETVLNGYLFAQQNALGLVGGALAALLVSIANVGMSSLLGFYCRFVLHRNWILKFLGFAMIVLWIVLAMGFNLAVAHFRDALESVGDWGEAAQRATETLISQPLSLASIESWLLVVIGALISIFAFLKGIYTDDPYLGYGKVSRSVLKARENYSDLTSDAIEKLEDHRDNAIHSLQDAHEEVRRGISEAVDALYGQSSLQAQLRSFLEQCEIKVAALLGEYRDANVEARSDPTPKSFNERYAFDEIKIVPIGDSPRKADAESEQQKVSDLVSKTINDIFEEFGNSVDPYREIEAVQKHGIVLRGETGKNPSVSESGQIDERLVQPTTDMPGSR